MMQGFHYPLQAVAGVAAHLTPWIQSQARTVWGGTAEWALEGTWLHLQRQLVTEALGRWPLISAQAPSAPTAAAPPAEGTRLLLRSSHLIFSCSPGLVLRDFFQE